MVALAWMYEISDSHHDRMRTRKISVRMVIDEMQWDVPMLEKDAHEPATQMKLLLPKIEGVAAKGPPVSESVSKETRCHSPIDD